MSGGEQEQKERWCHWEEESCRWTSDDFMLRWPDSAEEVVQMMLAADEHYGVAGSEYFVIGRQVHEIDFDCEQKHNVYEKKSPDLVYNAYVSELPDPWETGEMTDQEQELWCMQSDEDGRPWMVITIGGRPTSRPIPAMVEHFQNVHDTQEDLGAISIDAIFVIGRQIHVMLWDPEHSGMHHMVFEKRVVWW